MHFKLMKNQVHESICWCPKLCNNYVLEVGREQLMLCSCFIIKVAVHTCNIYILHTPLQKLQANFC